MAYIKMSGKTFKPDLKPEKAVKKKSHKIKSRSKSRLKQEAEYKIIAPIFLEGKFCPVTGGVATQVHHKKGRIGKLLTDIRFFLAVSDEGHDKIERNPEWARDMGYSLLRNAKQNEPTIE